MTTNNKYRNNIGFGSYCFYSCRVCPLRTKHKYLTYIATGLSTSVLRYLIIGL